jgi:hypothetical protein
MVWTLRGLGLQQHPTAWTSRGLMQGMEWLKVHDARVQARAMTVSIPSPQGPLVLRAHRSAPAIPVS